MSEVDTIDEEKRKFCISIFQKCDEDKPGYVETNELLKRGSSVSIEADKDHRARLDGEETREMITHNDYRNKIVKYIKIYIRYLLPKRKHIPLQTEPDGPYEQNYSCCPPAIALILISLLELGFFIVDEVSERNLRAEGPTSKFLIYHPFKRYEVWRYLTYMFVHVGSMHLIINLVVQLFLGIPLEMVHKGGRVLTVYFSGVVAGSLATSVTEPRVYLAGASGGVYALITAHIATIFMNWKEMEFPGIQLGIFVTIIAADVGTSVYNWYVLQLESNIGYTAHLAGGIAGLLVGIWTLKNFVPTRKETYIWWCALTFYVICLGTMVLLNIVWTNHFPPNFNN